MKRIKAWYSSVSRFVNKEIWHKDLSEFGFWKKTGYTATKVCVLAFKHFKDDKLQLRASALTFFSLLSIVPVLAMAFGIAKGFNLDRELEAQILKNFEGHEEVLTTSLDFAHNLLANTKGGLIAGIGLAFLLYTVMQLLSNIEKSFNDIWYISKDRSLTRKMTDYLSIMLLAPILLIVSNSLTIAITRQIGYLTETVEFLALFKGVIFPLLRLMPYVVIWILFTLVYLIMPNTNVTFKAGAIAGITAGSAFLILEWGLIYFGVGVAEYNAIYGSFAALPLFLVWLQLSWLIVLIGAELSYAIQNVQDYEPEDDEVVYSIESKKKVAVSVALLLIRNFKEAKPPTTIHQIHRSFSVSDKLLREVLQILLDANIITETKVDEYPAYQPGRDIGGLDVSTVLISFERTGAVQENGEAKDKLTAKADELIKEIEVEVSNSKANRLLSEI